MNRKKTFLLIIFIGVLMTAIDGQTSPEYKILFEKAKFTMETKGDLNGAINLFNDIIKKYPKEREYAAKSQLYIGLCYEKLGVKEAQKAYQKVVNSYPEQTETVKLANAKLSFLLRAEAPVKIPEITIRRIWSGPDANGEGGPSPDGRYLSFTDWEIPALAVHDLATGENRQLTKKEPGDTYGYPDYSIFSPDGKQIAYRWWTGRDVCDIRMIALDGSDERIIYRTKDNYPSNFNWSPDGKYILTKLDERPVLISVVDGSIQDLAIENPGMMCISPDGNYIVFDTPQDKNLSQNDIFVYDRTTHLTSGLVGHPADDKLLGWSPDGRRVLFSSDRRGSVDAWLISVSSGQPAGAPEMVRSDIGGLGYGMGFTQVGAYFFSNWGESRDVFVTQLDIQTGKLLSPPAEVAETYLGSNWGPDFSADGKSLAYINGQGGITIQSLETSEKKQIKPNVEIRRTNHMAGLRWTADYRSLVGTGVIGQGREGLFRINLSTSETKLFFEPAHPWIQAFDISPDGKKVFYQGIIPDGGSLYIWDSESGQESQILAGAEVWSLAVSPDGKQLAYFGSANLNKPGGLFVVPSSGGTPRLVIEAEDNRGAIAWSPDGRRLIYAIPSKSSTGSTPAKIRYQFWSVASDGGEPKQLDLTVDGMIMLLRIHPDGQRVVYQTHRSRSEIWVMENFLPKEPKQPDNQLTLRKLDYAQLSYPYAEISPDGKKIAYYIAGQTKQGIGILDLVSGTAKVIIESGAGGQASKVWSPQSDKIAYRLNDNEIHICDIDGAKPQLFYKSPEYRLYPTDWSKDGKKIVCFFEAKDKTLRVGTITAGGQVSVLVSGNQTEFSSEPKFSPDGNYIAFSRKDEKGNSDIFILSSDGSKTESVAPYPGRDECPVWSPDGKYLFFLSDRNRSADLWGIRTNQGKAAGAPFIIKRDLGWRTLVQDLTADGKLFMFTQSGNEPVNLFTILLDEVKGSIDGPVTPVTVYPTDHSFPRYSPDGKKIAYLSRRGQIGFPKLFVMDEKGDERELPLPGHYATNIAWHPENSSLFFTGWDKTQKTGVFEVSLVKEEIKLVYSSDTVDMKTGKGRLVNINLIPDAGKMMFFKLLEGGYVEVLTCMPDGLNPAVVIPRVKMPLWGLPSPKGENICYRLGDSLMVVSAADGSINHIGSSTVNLEASWSPNGENLMFREGSNLRVYSVKEKSARTLYKAASGKITGGMEMYANIWSPDGNRVIITEQDTSAASVNPQKLILINPADGSSGVLGESPNGYRLKELRWSPDGSKVMATGNSVPSVPASTYEYWVLENFLPK